MVWLCVHMYIWGGGCFAFSRPQWILCAVYRCGSIGDCEIVFGIIFWEGGLARGFACNFEIFLKILFFSKILSLISLSKHSASGKMI